MPPNSIERTTDHHQSQQWKLANKKRSSSQCMNDFGKSYGDNVNNKKSLPTPTTTSTVLTVKKKSDTTAIDRLSIIRRCATCGRTFEKKEHKKLVRNMMKTLGLLIILGFFVQESRHFFVPTIPITLLATEEFIDEPIPVILPASTESPPVEVNTNENSNKPPLQSEEDKRDDGTSYLNKNGANGGASTINNIPEVSSLSPEEIRAASVKQEIISADADIQSSQSTATGYNIPGGKSEDTSNNHLQDSNPNPTTAPVENILSLISGKEESVMSKDFVENNNTDSATSGASDSGNLTSETSDSTSKEIKKESEQDEADELQRKRVDEDPIPSYMEWAQKKQQELVTSGGQIGGGQVGGASGGNGAGGNHNSQASSSQNQSNRSTQVPVTVTMNAKNFASPDCGAKVIESNPGTQNPSGVLSSSHDEYMLNKCGISIWFVVQLCEPLTIETIALGNLELFSSSPKEIELGISDRYPTRDWTKIGPFTLPDARAIHPVVLPSTNSSTFGKYVKVTILSHHGSEHYCPVSVIKVNGKTEYEVLESETGEGDQNKPVDFAVDEEPLEEEPSTPVVPEQRSLKDTVLNLINKALQTVVKSGLRLKTSDESDSWMLQSDCVSVTQCIPKSELDKEIYTLLSCNSSTVLPFLALKSPWCGWDYCHSIFSSSSIGLPWQPEGFYQSIFGGPSVLHALCHYLKPMRDGCSSSNSFTLIPNSSLSDSVSSSLPGLSSSEVSNQSIPALPETEKDESKDKETATSGQVVSSTDHSPGEINEIAPPESVSEPTVEQQVESPPQGWIQHTANIVTQSHETQIPAPGPIGSATEDTMNKQGDQGSGTVGQQYQNQQGQQKESVFVRLTNRIKSLERNQSLTASYLEELSKRFKKHNEETVILNESNKKALNESKVKIRQLDDFYRQELQSLRRNMEDVREKLFNTQLQRSLLIFMCLGQSVIIVLGCLWTRRKLSTFENTLNLFQEGLNSNQSCGVQNSTTSLLGRKRSNSDVTPLSMIQSKPRKLKKKAKKNVHNLNLPELNSLIDQEIKSDDHSGVTKLGRFTLSPSPVSFSVKSEAVSANEEFGITPLYPKENIDPKNPILNPPKFVAQSHSQQTSSGLVPKYSSNSRPSTLVTKVDSPFTFQSTWMSSLDSSVSTSGRFALLASPAKPDSPVRTHHETIDTPPAFDAFKRFGSSNRSSVSSTASYNILKGSGSSNATTTTNGHHRQESSGNSSTTSTGTGTNNGKKTKKGGFKSFMPKLFDR